MSFQRFVCWEGADAHRILKTEALESYRSVFQSVHVPISGFEVSGSRAAWVEEKSDRRLLDALSRPELRHALCVIEGTPGSGKSHLIRWLRFNWRQGPDQTDIPVLVTRSRGNLEDTLKSLREALPEDLRDFFAGIGQAQKTSLEGRAMDFQSKLANSFKRGYFESDLPDADWAEKWELHQVMDAPLIRGEWKAPRRILEILSGMGGERNSRTAEFTLTDVVEYALLLRRAEEGLGVRAVRFKQRLYQEAGKLKKRFDEGATEQAALAELGETAEIGRLLEALRARMNHAVQDLLGVSGQALKNAFTRLREQLAKRQKRLVLLFEDITSMQGVEDQLVNVMIASSETEENHSLCDLITVAGVTPNFFPKIFNAANLTQRITLHVRFGVPASGDVQELFALKTPEERIDFATRYLRAVRAGIERIEKAQPKDTSAVPNRCETCEHRPVCHRVFGQHGGVGLYPLTSNAINHIYDELRHPRGQETVKTPRGMIQSVLGPALLHPASIQHGEFPLPEIETEYLPEHERHLIGRLERIVEAQVPEGPVRERMRRLIAWWGNRKKAETAIQDGLPTFADVPRGVFETFELPWLGDAAMQPKSPIVEPKAPEEPKTPPMSAPPPRTKGVTPTSSPGKPPPKKDAPKAPRAASFTEQQHKTRSDELAAWARGEPLEDQGFWSDQVAAVLRELPWRALGVEPFLQHRLFSPDAVMLEGARRADTRHFVVPCATWVRDGLDALLALRSKAEETEKGEAEREHHRRMYARMLRKLSELAREHVRKRTPSTEQGGRWSPASTATQLLLARAWLRGSTRPDKPLHEQWNTLLDPDAPDGKASGDYRVQSWGEIVQKLANTASHMRDALQELTNLPQDAWDEKALFCSDAGEVAPAMSRLTATLELDPLPSENLELSQKLKVLQQISENAHYVRQRLTAAAEGERNQVIRHVKKLESLTHGRSLPEHLRRGKAVVEKIHKIDPHAPQAPIKDWNEVVVKLRANRMIDDKGEPTPSMDELEHFLSKLGPEEKQRIEDAAPPDALLFALDAPAADAAFVVARAQQADEALRALYRYIAALTQGVTQGGGSLAMIHEAGGRLGAAVQTLLQALPTGGSHG